MHSTSDVAAAKLHTSSTPILILILLKLCSPPGFLPNLTSETLLLA